MDAPIRLQEALNAFRAEMLPHDCQGMPIRAEYAPDGGIYVNVIFGNHEVHFAYFKNIQGKIDWTVTDFEDYILDMDDRL